MFCLTYAPSACLLYPKRRASQRSNLAPTRFRVCSSLPGNEDRFKVEYTPWLIVGLGNPGNKFHGTRHNVGFEMIDQLARREGILMNTIQSKALIGIGAIEEVPVLLAKPQTYMNFSGESVGSLAAHYQVPLRHILLIYDEMSLPNGVLKLIPKGGYGHHNGLKSVIGNLNGRRHFPRLCIGIGKPPGMMDLKAFLLQKFSPVERKQMDEGLEQGAEAVKTLVLNGFNEGISRFNLVQKYKFHRV
ncbi:PREDICTED: chloroplastic group IIB intron splicing facilitator CRS2-B, chloroplastic [Tarenaya hassleriana]|uniref:chloroplastic group IIB intron splicing facilitator CRS2-B, chloroplastic n=1 Tax=Tarenaya hassleriana TaxID=28532 RepID=UPI00053C9783|nr:PREDICTED: chloroplastic group IIB intron splicing facilitator CRS2-B, chloroplastic [Tarenaya hassleriana]